MSSGIVVAIMVLINGIVVAMTVAIGREEALGLAVGLKTASRLVPYPCELFFSPPAGATKLLQLVRHAPAHLAGEVSPVELLGRAHFSPPACATEPPPSPVRRLLKDDRGPQLRVAPGLRGDCALVHLQGEVVHSSEDCKSRWLEEEPPTDPTSQEEWKVTDAALRTLLWGVWLNLSAIFSWIVRQPVRSQCPWQQITSLDSLPSIEEVYSRAARYTSSPQTLVISHSSAMVARGGQGARGRSRGRGVQGRGASRGGGSSGSKGASGGRFCTHCQHTGHTANYCYDLHPELRGLHVSAPSSRPPSGQNMVHLTRAEYDELTRARQLDVPSGPVATLAHRNDPTCLLSTTATPRPWVIDSGATHHMMLVISIFLPQPHRPSTSVTLADGSRSK
ncbi:hypothetical protein NL676_002527 [Syzygium grande]|nr:hypothetical protein NL676_002527 [Syzygium grande]